MKLTKEQFKDFLKKHVVVLAMNTEEYYAVPANTKLYFGLDSNVCINTYNIYTKDKNEEFNHDFNYKWYFDSYTGEFIILETVYPDEVLGGYKWLKPGTLVDISPNLKNHPEFNDWDDAHKEMAGQKGLEIRNISRGDYIVLNKDKTIFWFIPAIYVKEHIPEEHECECSNGFKYCPHCGNKLK